MKSNKIELLETKKLGSGNYQQICAEPVAIAAPRLFFATKAGAAVQIAFWFTVACLYTSISLILLFVSVMLAMLLRFQAQE